MIPIASTVTLENAAAKRLLAGALWFSARDCIGRVPRMAGIARVLDKRGAFLASAFTSPKGRYLLRVITRDDVPIDRSFWLQRIRAANDRRRRLLEVTDAYRMVFSEADGIPSVVIDRFNDVIALQLSSAGAESIKQELVELLAAEFAPAGICEKNDLAARKAEGLPLHEGLLFGDGSATEVREGDQRFEVDVLAGQKSGAYLDYRRFRLQAREFVKGNCLDAFCYQGWFACQIASKAKRVVAVDASADALAAAGRNARLNGHANIECVKADAFAYCEDLKERFDFIHLDPPAMVREHAKLGVAERAYRKLLAGALRALNPEGVLMVSSCSHKFSERMLEAAALGAIAEAGRAGEILWRGIQDSDHPVLRGLPESLYLKALAARVS